MEQLDRQYAAWRATGFKAIDVDTMPDLAAFAAAMSTVHPASVSAAITHYVCTPKPVEYVLGFAFTPEWRVALIEKTHPAWQAGKLNGIGGKIEKGEGFVEAMRREFAEETGVRYDAWRFAGLLHGTDWRAYVMTATSSDFHVVRTMTDEKVGLYPTGAVRTTYAVPNLLDNVSALVTLCSAHPGDTTPPFFTLRY